MLKKIKETVDFLKQQTDFKPKYGIILGTGLSNLVSEIQVIYSIDYEKIPNFPTTTVEGHSGKLIFAYLSEKPIVVMQGRFHFYEGYSMFDVVMPVRIMKLLGVTDLFVSNASGGVNPDYNIGDLMIINDHINLMPNPLIGPNINELGTRFPDMSNPYCKKMITLATKIAKENNIKIQQGVYVGVTGPTLETPAEYFYMRKIGGDTVGMSTVPEVIAARHMNISCFAISVITDLGVSGKIKKVTHQDVQKAAQNSEPKLTLIIKNLLKNI